MAWTKVDASRGVSPNWCRGVSESGASSDKKAQRRRTGRCPVLNWYWAEDAAASPSQGRHLAGETAQSFVRHTARRVLNNDV